MTKPPKEIRDIEKQFRATLIAARDLHSCAMELGIKDIEEAAEIAHEALMARAIAKGIKIS